LLRKVYFQAQAIPRLPRFRGKKLVVDGNLDLTSFRNQEQLTDLGNIKVNGNVNISYTNIKSLDNVEILGHRSYWSTPYEAVMLKRKQQKKYNEQEVRRENNEWSLDGTDEEGEKAHAAFEYAVQEGNLKELNDEEEEELTSLKLRLSELEQQMEAEEDEERYDELSSEFDEVQEEIDDLEKDTADVYDLYPMGSHYDMTTFESLSTGDEYAVGTQEEANSSLEDYFEEHVDNPTQYFDKNHLSYYIDEEEVKDYFRDMVEEWVRDSPEDYGVEKELSSDQEEEIWLLEMEKWVYENEGVRAPISDPTKEEGDVFDFMDSEDNRFQYKNISSDSSRSNWVLYKDGAVVSPHQIYDDEDTDEHQEAREERISDIEYEIEEIKDNPDGDPDEDSISDTVENYLEDEVGRDAIGWLDQMGMDYENFIDKDRLKDDLVRDADYGELNGYDSNYDEIKVNGTYYVVMRID
jgi:predicted  nucleic acid-binding Zn-ribbon protein